MTAAFKNCARCGAPFYRGRRQANAHWERRQYCSRKCARISNIKIVPIADRLDQQSILPVTESGCWIWLGLLAAGGYGSIRIGNKMERTHRASWECHCGKIPTGVKVLHRCDIPACINPDHLFLGTQADNVADMTAKGRNVSSPGERNGRAKLTADQVLEIRKTPGTTIEMAGRYGVSPSMISQIRLGKSWRAA